MSVFGNTIVMSNKSLDFLWTKQGITANNIANAETPGYKAKYVTFEETFKSKLKAAGGDQGQVRKSIQSASYQVRDSKNETARLDGNNVNTDVENVELARTGLQYQYVLQSVNSDITRLRTVIKGQ